MEDVLDLSEEAYDPLYPTVCFDEKLVAPEANKRSPEPMKPGRPERVDYEYERLGTANLFFFVEFHHTPKHGSWLNMAEIEISIFARGCLSRRVASMQDLRQRIATLGAERNAHRCTILWRFTSHDARSKLHHLYPVLNHKVD